MPISRGLWGAAVLHDIELRPADAESSDFAILARALDADLCRRYGSDQADYDGHNVLGLDASVVIAYIDGVPVGCGALRSYDPDRGELKRMFVDEAHRGRGVARVVLGALEELARVRGYRSVLLETGILQTEAIALYSSAGYERVDNYGPYLGMSFSVCFAKPLDS